MCTKARLGCAIGVLLAAAALVATAGPAHADAADATDASGAGTPQLEEVIVTARRREENLQAVPISVAVLNTAQLDQQNVLTASDLSRVVPGLSIQSTAANRADTTFSIRGQGETFGEAAPGVVPYFAEVPNFGSANGAPAIYDLQSVQVLKGPQGTLFGKNTTGGAILFVPQMPTDELSGYIDTRFGNYGTADVEGAFGAPIIGDKLMFRVSGQSLNRDGYTIYQLDGAKLDNENRQSGRAILTFRPIEDFENTTIYQIQRNRENGSGAVLAAISLDPAINVNAIPVAAQLQQQLAEQQSLGIRRVLGNDPDHFVVRNSEGGINTTTWKADEFLTLKNIFSYSQYNQGQSYDLDATNLTLLHVLNPVDINKQLTEELQAQLHAGPVNAVVGYYYEDVWNPYQLGYRIQEPSIGLGPLAAFGPIADIGDYGSGQSKSRAVFGQVDWAATEQLALTAGARYTSDPITSGISNTVLFLPLIPPPYGPVLPLQSSPELNHTFDAVTWNVAVDYQIDPSLNVYGTVRKGFKQGGFNGTALLPQDKAFQPEFNIDYEVGAKGENEVGGWRVRYDADAFYDHYTNIQRFENIVELGIPQTITKNAAAGYIAGAEFQLTVVPSQYFQVTASYTYLDARYTNWTDPLNGNLSANRFPNTPQNQLTVTPLLTLPMAAEAGTLTVQSNIYYQSSIATDPFNVPNGVPTVDLDALGANLAKAYTRVDFRVDWGHIYRTPLSAALYVTNAFNTSYIVGTNNQLNAGSGTVSALYGDPRFYGIELRYDFGRAHASTR
jgi:iron complex outermembrane recepter protein